MNKLNESVLKYIDTSDDRYATQDDFVMKDRKAIKDEMKKRFKEHEKNRDEFIKINHKREGHTMQKTKGLKKLKLSESLFEDTTTETKDDVYYSSKRGSLLDIITMYLTDGEKVFLKKNKDGKDTFMQTTRGGLGVDNGDISVDYGDDGSRPSITVRVTDEATASKVEEIADRFDKISKVKPCKYFGDKAFQVIIYIDEDDFEGDYEEEGVLVKPSEGRGRKKRA